MNNSQIEQECSYLYNLGNNDRYIAIKLNRKFKTEFVSKHIQTWRKINNLPVNHTYGSLSCKITDRVGDKIISMLKDGKIIEEISLELGISIGRIKVWIYKNKIPAKKLLDSNRKETIIKLFKEGHSDKEISDILGGTPKSIYQWRRRKGYI